MAGIPCESQGFVFSIKSLITDWSCHDSGRGLRIVNIVKSLSMCQGTLCEDTAVMAGTTGHDSMKRPNRV